MAPSSGRLRRRARRSHTRGQRTLRDAREREAEGMDRPLRALCFDARKEEMLMKKVLFAFLLVAVVGCFGAVYAAPDQPGAPQSDTPPAVTAISAWMNIPCQDGCAGCDQC